MGAIPPEFVLPTTGTDPKAADETTFEAAINAALTILQNRIDAKANVQPGRPGEYPAAFGSTVAGLPGRLADLTATVVDETGEGKAVELTGAGVVAWQETINITYAGTARFTFRIRRETDPADPAGDTVRCGVAWIADDGTVNATAAFQQDTTLDVADGVQIITATVQAADAPATAKRLRPYTETFGTDGVTRTLEISEGSLAAPALVGLVPEASIPSEIIGGTVYVSPAGNNSNSGGSSRAPVRDVERACEIVSGLSEETKAILVSPMGNGYNTDGEIVVPDKTHIIGLHYRCSSFIPTTGNEQRNVFLLGSGSSLLNISGKNWQLDSFDNPTKGFLAAFNPGTRYFETVQLDACTMRRSMPPEFIPAPLDPDNGNPALGMGSGLALAKKSVVDPSSPVAQMILNECTNAAPNGIGFVTDGTYLNAVNCFSLYSHRHFMALNGGRMDLDGCATQMGRWTCWSENFHYEVNPGAAAVAPVTDAGGATAIRGAKSAIIDAMWAQVVADGYSGDVNEATSRFYTGILVDALANDLQGGEQFGTMVYLVRLFTPAQEFIAPNSAIPAFMSAYEGVRNGIQGLTSAGSEAFVESLIDLVKATVQTPTFKVIPSELNADPLNMRRVGSGENLRAIYSFAPQLSALETIKEINRGVVNFSGTVEEDGQYLQGGIQSSTRSGVLRGSPVARTFNPIARRIARRANGGVGF